MNDIRIFEQITNKKDALKLQANIISLELWFKKRFFAFHHGDMFSFRKLIRLYRLQIPLLAYRRARSHIIELI